MSTRRNMEAAVWRYKSTSPGEGERSSGSKAWNSLNVEIIICHSHSGFVLQSSIYPTCSVAGLNFLVFLVSPKWSEQLEA